MISTSFLYFLQEAPGSIILDAFKNECKNRNEDWKSLKSQVWVVRFFIRHPLIKQYPPKEQVLNSFLKLYIREVEEHYLANRSNKLARVAEGCSEGNDEELFHPDLLAAHVNSFLSRNENESTMCYKSFVNYYASRSEAVPSASPQAKKCFNPFVGQPRSIVSESAITASYNNATLDKNEENQEPLSSLMSSRKNSFNCTSPSMSSAHGFASYAPLWAAESLSYVWNTLRVARNTFQNVGLSLWPAAFALAQLLSQEFCGDSGIIDCIKTAGTISPKLRIVELGAGAGLTPCVLAAQRGFQEKVSCFCATDYQIELIENMRKNFWLNGVYNDEKVKECERGVTTQEDKIPVQNSAAIIDASSLRSPVQHEPQEAAMRRSAAHKENFENAVGEGRKNEAEVQEVENKSCSSECTTVKFSLKLLDWNEQFNCDSFFRTHGCDLVLGADCIYDVSVIPALATVIHSAVTSSTTSLCSGTSSCAVLVQTHRQASTMKVFFDHIRAYHMSVKSYRVHLIPKEEAEKRYRPLSASPSLPTSQNCIPLGNLEHVFSSYSIDTKNDSYFSPSAKVCVLVPDEVLLNGNFRSQEATGIANHASLDSRTRCSDGIEDGWIGAYFVSMVGILGVHIITASEGKEETKNV